MDFVVDAGVVAVIIGVIQALKSIHMNITYAPMVSLALGVIYAVAFNIGGTVAPSIFDGLVLGLSAAGLYSGVKTTYTGVTSK